MNQDELEDLIKFLSNTPNEIRRMVESASDSKMRWQPSGDLFSVVENVCHLRDIEVEGFLVRINRILKEDQPFLPDLDGARLAKERDYNKQDLNDALNVFDRARANNLSVIRGLQSEQLSRTGTLENSGEVTLGRLLELMREHDQVHIADLTSLREKLTAVG